MGPQNLDQNGSGFQKAENKISFSVKLEKAICTCD